MMDLTKTAPSRPLLPVVIHTASTPIVNPKPEYFLSATLGELRIDTQTVKAVVHPKSPLAYVPHRLLLVSVKPRGPVHWLPPIEMFVLN